MKSELKLKIDYSSLERKKRRLEDEVSAKKIKSVELQNSIDEKDYEISIISITSIMEHFITFVSTIVAPTMTYLILMLGDKWQIKSVMASITILVAIIKIASSLQKDFDKKSLQEEKKSLKDSKKKIDLEISKLTEELTKVKSEMSSLEEEIKKIS